MFFQKEQLVNYLTALKNDEFQKHLLKVRKGRVYRSNDNLDYESRLIYTNELRNFVYNSALMHFILSDDELKQLFFRTFGYKGSLNFRIYPNAWLRDLPLLDIGENAYLGDGILLGTNQVSQDQEFITVGEIKIGAWTILDQKVSIGYDCSIGANCKIGLETAIGIHGYIGDYCVIEERCTLGHGVKIADQVKIGQCSHIGNMSIIESGVVLGNDSKIPPFSKVTPHGIFNRRTGKPLTPPVKEELMALN